MSIYKRGRIYWYKFTWNGESIRESTKQGNQHIARQMEAAHRAALAKGEVGIREREAVPVLSEFISKRIESLLNRAPAKRHGWITTNRTSQRSPPISHSLPSS